MSSKTVKFCVCNLILIFFNQLESVVIFESKYSSIKIDSYAICKIEHPFYVVQGIINRDDYGITRGANIIFENSTLIDSGNKVKFTGVLDPNDYVFILNGDSLFSGHNGTFYEPIFVNGKNNLIEGYLTIDNDITLQDSNSSLSVNLISTMNGNIYLNGGMLCLLENNLKFKDGERIIGPGTIYETGSKMIYGTDSLIFNENLYFIDAEDIQFNSNVKLQGTWTFSGNAVIGGNSNLLCLMNGKIVVERGSSLLIKNLILHDVCAENLVCMDNSATITLQNVTVYLGDDYTFARGKFAISNQVKISGSSKFIYQSPMESTILSRSTLILDNGATFSYDPGCMRKDLIRFEDPYSTLELNGATLHATLTGMQLTGGYLLVNGNSYLSSEQSSNLDEGITFGDDNPQDDLYCEILKGSALELTSGSLKYHNVLPTSWVMENNQSTLEINANCNLYLYQDLNIEPGSLNYKGRGGFFYAPGKNLTGSLNVNGYIDYEELS